MSLVNEPAKETPVAPDLSYLKGDDSTAANMIADVKAKVEHMKRLQLDMIAAEAQYEHAKELFEKYKATVVVTAMTNAGVFHLQDENGNFVKLESKYYCNPNKNDADRLTIEKWLKSIQADHLLKHQAIVSAEQMEKLREEDIPFADKTDINTNSLKAFLLDALGYKGGVAKLKLSDIPDCVHFTVQQEVVTG